MIFFTAACRFCFIKSKPRLMRYTIEYCTVLNLPPLHRSVRYVDAPSTCPCARYAPVELRSIGGAHTVSPHDPLLSWRQFGVGWAAAKRYSSGTKRASVSGHVTVHRAPVCTERCPCWARTSRAQPAHLRVGIDQRAALIFDVLISSVSGYW